MTDSLHSEILVTGTYQGNLVYLSFFVSLFSVYTALSLVIRARTMKDFHTGVGIVGGAIAIGGGVWSMHSIGMQAFHLPVPLSYHSGISIISLVIAVTLSGIALYLSHLRPYSRGRIIASGSILGTGALTMHYTGMAAVQWPGTLHYSPGLALASGIMAVGGSILSFFILEKLPGESKLFQHNTFKLTIALILSSSFFGMHYTGIAAIDWWVPASPVPAGKSTEEMIELLVFNISILWLIILGLDIYSSGFQRQSLVNERRNLFNMLDRLPACFHLQAPDHSIPFANRMFRDRFGDPQQRCCYEVMHNRTLPCEPCPTFRVFETKTNTLSIWESNSGETYMTVCTPFKDIDGSDLVMEMAIDITEQKKAERELILLKEEAESANRAKSEFLSQISHELRTPLNAILGFSQLLLLNPVGYKAKPEFIQEIYSSGQHLLHLIDEMLDFSAIESGKLDLSIETFPLAEQIEGLLHLVQPLAKKHNVHLINQVQQNNPLYICADKTRLTQSLFNLVSNAIEYNNSGGTVTLQAQQCEDSHIRISISDTGQGITQDQMDQLFEPFQWGVKKNEALRGVTLGLPISRQLVEMMNGRLGVESTPGKGSCFSIDLPKGSHDSH